MPPLVLFCGFRDIEDVGSFFRDQALEKGHRLFENNHVYAVREEDGVDITAKCHSQQGKHVYDVTIRLNPQSRKIITGSCTCRYGVLGNRSNTVRKQQPREMPPSYILRHFPDIETPFTDILRMMDKNQVELECSQTMDDILDLVVDNVQRSEVEELLQNVPLEPSCGQELGDCLHQLTDAERSFFQRRVACSDILSLCMATLAQSKCARWYQERKMRISSSKAHTILRTKKTPQELVSSLMNEESFTSEATSYGLRTEPKARRLFEGKVRGHVTEVGLLVHNGKPWLCGSADGLFGLTTGTVLLEIKCPSSIRNSLIVDITRKVTFVSYLVYVDGKLCLKQSHRYYTQVQVLMYILHLEECFFFVYTSVDNVTLLVTRNDDFLDTAIPTLQDFYFDWYLPALARKYQS
ncbi:uncharacterized protein LOC120844851 isoform X2 [Ixodes scapularis]|uniref:uncharacterized protein LOC120844851 isoform X2 n=2 Tax=Ixodes scapularis TaxID=6945 RepID=UPI001A9F9208|nr:uncharacterized protein LOC120844851 isoform X2 [Ixodes scapularis]